jgi:hypothetical protein
MFGAITKPTRVELEPVTVIDLDLAQLATDAKKELGYSVLQEVLTSDALANVLRTLEIDPFDMAEVNKYKEAMRKKWHRKPADEGYHYEANWNLRPLAGYDQPVPEFVLEKALEVKRAFPNVTLEVDTLMLRTYKEVPVDPFLVVSYGRERYYIEVWDEPEFEAVPYKR